MAVRLILACVILFLAALSVGAEESRAVPSAFATDGSHHVFVRVSVNGAKDVWMLLDTGTAPSTIDRGYARSLGLKLGRETNTGKGVGGDAIPIAKTRVTGLRIGTTQRADVAFTALPFTIKTPDGETAVGVIGHSALVGRTLVIDYPRREIRLSEASELANCHCGLPVKLPYGIPAVPITLGGHEAQAIIDTGGAYDVLVPPPSAARFGLANAMMAGQTGTGAGYGGSQEIRSGPGPALRLGALEKPVTGIAYVNLPIRVDVAIGSWFLKDYRMTIDYRARRALFEAASDITLPRTPR
jgi:hypothetical protein